MKNSERTPEQIEKRRASQKTEEYKIKKRKRDAKYRRLKVLKPKIRLSPEEAKRKRNARKKLQKKKKFDINNEWINNYKKERCCVFCGYKKYPEILHFHHVKMDKKFEISRKKDKSLDTLKKEVEKCKLLCPNCHSELHYLINKNRIHNLRTQNK